MLGNISLIYKVLYIIIGGVLLIWVYFKNDTK